MEADWQGTPPDPAGSRYAAGTEAMSISLHAKHRLLAGDTQTWEKGLFC